MIIGDGVNLSFPCGGNGNCGKCRIKIKKGTLPVTAADKRHLSEAELADGIRLACQADIPADVEVQPLWNSEEDIVAVGIPDLPTAETETGKDVPRKSQGIAHDRGTSNCYGAAIDIGTTTIAASLVDLSSGRVLGTVTGINHQRSFGADVISRINAACSGESDALRTAVTEDINNCIKRLCEEQRADISDIKKIVVSGNTTMEHILLGYSCEGLGRAPFKAVSTDLTEHKATEILGSIYCADTVLFALPGVSVYVGADILAGICECGMADSDETMLFIDLGTNGEMAIGNRNRIIAASTAAGPAFEGGNISCGIGSIPGAIRTVDIDMNTGGVKLGIIGDRLPVGLCGTGVVETVCELLGARIADATGLLDEEYFEDGFELAEDIFFTQKDIREFQLAKGAVRAGIEVLAEEYFGTDKKTAIKNIDRLCLAGSFGTYINADKAACVGLIPRELAGRTQSIGNTSLKGAIAFLRDEEYAVRLEAARSKCTVVELADSDSFRDLFLEKMNFYD